MSGPVITRGAKIEAGWRLNCTCKDNIQCRGLHVHLPTAAIIVNLGTSNELTCYLKRMA